MIEVNLHARHLGELPDSAYDAGAVSLLAAENDLVSISPRIGEMRALRTLDLGHNKLTAVPAELGALVDLSDFLYLHDNALTSLQSSSQLSLPASLSALKKLRYLNIGENPLTEFPPCVLGMTALVELRCEKTPISRLPDEIGGLSQLRELHLRDCTALADLPASIGRLRELRVLDLRATRMTTLPASLASLPHLYKVDLRWTRIDAPFLDELRARGVLVYR